jgi:hypothetical protein
MRVYIGTAGSGKRPVEGRRGRPIQIKLSPLSSGDAAATNQVARPSPTFWLGLLALHRTRKGVEDSPKVVAAAVKVGARADGKSEFGHRVPHERVSAAPILGVGGELLVWMGVR